VYWFNPVGYSFKGNYSEETPTIKGTVELDKDYNTYIPKLIEVGEQFPTSSIPIRPYQQNRNLCITYPEIQKNSSGVFPT